MELKAAPSKAAPPVSHKTLSWHRCPECSSRMIKADSSIENGLRFVWYDCSEEDCYGSWLDKQKIS